MRRSFSSVFKQKRAVMQTLPIDALLPDVFEGLRRERNLVIEAPPGAGKTTRVPAALLDAGLAEDGEVWTLEPRRIAARMSARRVAEERGERAGETVGYQVRFEDVSSESTRLRFLTEGVFARRLLSDPNLTRAKIVVLDEFHERRLHSDVALALLRRLQRSSRPDLKIVAMSATLDAVGVAKYLGDCPSLRSEGRLYPVSVEHIARPDERPLETQVVDALSRLLSEEAGGDVLVFLPGAAEIRRARAACETLAAERNLLVLPLHGELPAAEQDAAVRPADRRKVILSTNVAETSITIEGVAFVIDSGLARVASHSPWTGLPALNVARISQASATQRTGRAGRTREGRAVRLYTAQDFAARPAHEEAEVHRLDLAETALELHAAGARDLAAFDWFETPPAAALEAAETLLRRLKAIDEKGSLTETGEKMLRLPLHPRLARIIIEASRRKASDDACAIAALIGERDIREREIFADARTRNARREAKSHGPSDLLELLDLFDEAAQGDFAPTRLRALSLNPSAVRAVERSRRQLRRVTAKISEREGDSRAKEGEREIGILISILTGFPDRVARRRLTGAIDAKDESSELLLSGGGAAELSPESVVRSAEFLVAVDAEERRAHAEGRGGGRRAGALVRLASAIEPEWLIELFPEDVRETVEAVWNAQAERAETSSRLVYDQLTLTESRAAVEGDLEASRLLFEKASEAGLYAFIEREELERFLARTEFVSRSMPEANFPALSEDDALSCLEELCAGRRGFAELREAVKAGGLFDLLRKNFTQEQTRLLARAAPERIELSRRRNAKVNYERGREPYVASRLQDFFGMREGPRIASGRVPLVLHLLAPNQRPVQVTTDLAGFWQRHYPQIRRELSRRYPRHAWPEDPEKS